MGIRPLLKTAAGHVTPLAAPLARRWAQPGYFAPPDLAGLAARRVALLACHWIGDTFWATQVVPALRRRFPAAELLAITRPACRDLWHGLLPPDRVFGAPEVVSDRRREPVRWGGLLARARRLARLRLDLVIDLTGNRYAAAFAFLLRPRHALGFGGDERGWLYSVRVADARRPGRHLSEQPFRVIEPLLAAGPRPFAYRLPLRPPTPTRSSAAVWAEPGPGARPGFVLAPGAGWPAKQWPAERFAAVGRCLSEAGGAVVVTGAAGEGALCERVAAGVPGAHVFVGRPLGHVVALLAGARGLAANDSGLAHLAAALGRRTAAVFTGATDPALCGPLGPAGCVAVFGADAPPAEVAGHLLA